MMKFNEWLRVRTEAYGFGDESEENLDEELYGIRETIKNMLASGDLAQNWGDQQIRIRNLSKLGVDSKKLMYVEKLYQNMINIITKGYRECRDKGLRTANVHDDRARPIVRQTIQAAHQYFDPFQEGLRKLGSRVSAGHF